MTLSHKWSPNAAMVELCFEVEIRSKKMRLDQYLKIQLHHRSRALIQSVIAQGAVSCTRKSEVLKSKKSLKVQPGDKIILKAFKKDEPEVNFGYDVLFEDDVLKVINKPSPLPVHPAGSYFFNTLLTYMKRHEGLDYYLPHRIDKETTGVLVLTKNKDSCAILTKAFALRQVQKKYIAIVWGVPPDIFSIATPLKRCTESKIRLKMTSADACDPDGLTALTMFKKLRSFTNTEGALCSFIECSPVTGRQHQIRVHCMLAGHPIIGDKLYSLEDAEAFSLYEHHALDAQIWKKLYFARHALHASTISFTHPYSKEILEFVAPLPQDMGVFY